MPELPEVQTIAAELNRKLKNRIIKSVTANAPKMVAVGPAVLPPKRQVKSYKVIKFVKLLKGQKIVSVKRRAKLLIINLSRPFRGTLPTSWGGERRESFALAFGAFKDDRAVYF